MITKRYDPKLHDKCRTTETTEVKKCFKQLQVKPNPNAKDIDCILCDSNGNAVAYLEIERRLIWTRKKFPFDTVSVLERKAKYKKYELPVFILEFNKSHSNACVALIDDVTKEDMLQNMKCSGKTMAVRGEKRYLSPLESWGWGINNIEQFILEKIMCKNS